jgi:hypothetical protein
MSERESNHPARRVALFIESSRAYGRGLLSGIARYARTHDRWSITYRECRLGEFSPDWLQPRTWDGIIARVPDLAIARAIARSRRPAVDVLGQVAHPRLLSVYPDDEQVARLAAAHLLDSHLPITDVTVSDRNELDVMALLSPETGRSPAEDLAIVGMCPESHDPQLAVVRRTRVCRESRGSGPKPGECRKKCRQQSANTQRSRIH